MQVEQSGVSKFVSCATGATNEGRAYYRVSVADEEGEVLTFFTDNSTYNKVCNLQFGDYVQLIFKVSQWRTGINCRCIDAVIQKKNS